jgi:hypothetical protein
MEIPLADGPVPLAKQAAQYCLIDFNNYAALSQIPQKASGWYATFPWYEQTCGSHLAQVRPYGRNYYYLTTEESGTCTHSAGYIGYGAIAGPTYCKNPRDAALFPRRAGNGSVTDKDLGLEVTVQAGGYWKNLDINNLKVLEGPVVVYGYRSGQGWWYWGPLGAGDWYWTNGQNVSQMRIHSWNNQGMYVVDNIRITGY